MIIRLVRHGESQANTGAADPRAVGDHTIELTSDGRAQAIRAGEQIGGEFIRGALIYRSPYRRTWQTLDGILRGASVSAEEVRVFEDPRLREVEQGYSDIDAQEPQRAVHGSFYYRFEGGESPADCYDRSSGFLESLMRQAERKRADRAVVVTHGLTIRCLVMRFLHLTVEEFERLANPRNCDIVTLAKVGHLGQPQFKSGRWGMEGLRVR